MGCNKAGGGGGAAGGRGGTYGGGGGGSITPKFKAEAQAPSPVQAKKLYKNAAKNVNLKEYSKGPNPGEIGVTQFSPPSRGGAGKFYQKIVDRMGKTTFFDRWTKGDR